MWIKSAFKISEMKWGNTLLIIYHLLTDSQLNFVDLLVTDLKLETQIKDSDKGAEMFVIVRFGEATLKHSGSNKQRPHRPH